MYLAKIANGNKIYYQIRKPYRSSDNNLDYRVIYNLGQDPKNHFKVIEDHIVLFSSSLLKAVSFMVQGDADLALEKLLVTFLPEETRRRHQRFSDRSRKKIGKLTLEEKNAMAWQIHVFDRRRLYYLRYGAVDQSRLSKLHEKCCRPLIDMCRDEKEHFFIAEETALEPGMYVQYVHAIFNLQKYCTESFASWFPESLEKMKLEEYLLKELCRLNDDRSFWLGEDRDSFLPPHLQRYLIMFFDYSPRPRSFAQDFARSFMAGQRKFSWPEHPSNTSPEKIGSIFGTAYSELKNMNKEQLSKTFRKKAMQLHPDQGGDHDQFIELNKIYNALLQKKKRS